MNELTEHSKVVAVNVLREDVLFPCAVVIEEAVKHNISWMQAFANEYQIELAPHAKTTMTPALFNQQLSAGAWGLTVATAQQVRVAHQHGARCIVMANQLVGICNMRIISQCLMDDSLEFYCLVDSIAAVECLHNYFHDANQVLNVLVEVGVPDGRCGCREPRQVIELAQSLQHFSSIRLCGVEFYEGVLHTNKAEDVDRFIQGVCELFQTLDEQGLFVPERPIISGAGSVWFDRVAEHFAALNVDTQYTPVLRPGCYITHDIGIYAEAFEKVKARNQFAKQKAQGLVSCLEVWTHVLSIPEPGCAIVELGKRNVAFDAGLPQAVKWQKLNSEDVHTIACAEFKTEKIMDQHAFIRFPNEHSLAVGDKLGFSTSHPCLTFDKWRQIYLVNNKYDLLETMPTFF